MNHQRWRFCHVSSGVPLHWPLLDAGFTQPYFFYLSMVIFLDFYGFTVTLRTSVRFEAWKLKSNKLYSHLFYKKVSTIAVQISKNRYSRQVKR